MRCPACQIDNDRVIDSRASEDGFAIRRRRECVKCGRRFTTYERIEEAALKVIKRNGAREPFSRDKLRLGLARACWKRPVSDLDIDTLVTTLENQIRIEFEDEIESQQLGELVLSRLVGLDQVAYVRFASVYRRFKDLHDFVDELRPMVQQRKAPRGG